MKIEMINVNVSSLSQKLKFICFNAVKSFMIRTIIIGAFVCVHSYIFRKIQTARRLERWFVSKLVLVLLTMPVRFDILDNS